MDARWQADLHTIQVAALRAVDPALAVQRQLQYDASTQQLKVGTASWDLSQTGRIVLAAVGKASVAMTETAAEVLGGRLTEGVVVTKYGHAAGHRLPERVRVIEAGHPVPDEAGLAGAQTVRRLLTGLTERDSVLVLLSGGASALLPAPVEPVSLADLQTLTGQLLRAGATINELNAVRKHLDQLKGGQLARLAAPASLAGLILSDVVGDPLDVIASGPTTPDPTSFADVQTILSRYDLWKNLPFTLQAYFQAGLAGSIPETPKPGDPLFARVTNTLVGSNRIAAQAAVAEAQSLGYRTLLLSTFVEGEAREIGRMAAALAKGIRYHADPAPPPACLVWGGETTVTVRGSGRGGRNQELALAAAIALDGVPGVAVLALATDGTDGPTDAAGGIVDGATLSRARELGLDAHAALQNNDAYPWLEATGALLRTGPTGTNVNDLTVVLVT